MFTGVHHIGYMTKDLEAGIKYLEDTFGAKTLTRAKSPQGTADVAYLNVGEQEIELVAPYDKASLDGKPFLVLDHVGYYVDDLDSAIGQLKVKGVAFTGEPLVNVLGKRLCFVDPASMGGMKGHVTQQPK